jgi:citrate synthase
MITMRLVKIKNYFQAPRYPISSLHHPRVWYPTRMKTPSEFSAAEAATLLGISRATLYSYVSRGLVRSRPSASDPRSRHYLAEDILRLKTQQEQRAAPERVVPAALDWGTPVLESQLTLISSGKLYYRGHNVLHLAEQAHFEQVAMLLWNNALPAARPTFTAVPALSELPELIALPELTLLQRMQLALPIMAATDHASYDTRPAVVIRTASRIVGVFAQLISGSTRDLPVAELLQHGFAADARLATLLNMALIVCADHELNISAFTARCIASAGSSPYDVVAGGLAALAGIRHGGHTERVVALLNDIQQPAQAQIILRERLRRGDSIPGFGHRLYPDGDPRARFLLDQLARCVPQHAALQRAQALQQAAAELIEEQPTIDFALAVLAEVLHAPAGTALALFALGRTAGWIAHAMEEYALGRLIRPRANYTGPAIQS